MQHHVIRTQTIEVVAGDEGRARRTADAVAGVQSTSVLPELDELFSSLVADDEVVRLDRVVVDIGPVESASQAATLADRLLDRLHVVLPPLVDDARGRDEGDEQSAAPATGPLGALFEMLEFGTIPWYAPAPFRSDPEQALRELVEEAPTEARRLVGMLSPHGVRRLAVQFAPATSRAVIALFVAAEQRPVLAALAAWEDVVTPPAGVSAVSHAIDLHVAALSWLREQPAPKVSAFLDHLLVAATLDADRARAELTAAASHDAQLPAEVVTWLEAAPAVTAQRSPSAHRRGEAAPDRERDSGVSQRGGPGPAATGTVGGERAPTAASGAEVGEDTGAEGRRRPARGGDEVPVADGKRLLDRGSHEASGPQHDEHAPGAERPAPAAVPHGGEPDGAPADRAERDMRGRSARPDATSRVERRPSGDAAAQPIDRTARSEDRDGEVDAPRVDRPRLRSEVVGSDGVYVANAGLVLCWPFLPAFFERLGLASDRQFRDEAAHERAVQILHHVATGSSEGHEHEMVLNKLLCGWPIEQPIAPLRSVTPQESDEAADLLRSLITQWGALGSTSIDGLRSTFLMREGRLAEQDVGWTLLVPRIGADVLIDRLPWGIGVVMLAWMDQPVVVEW